MRGLGIVAFYVLLLAVLLTGYVKNIIKLSDCDFEKSYKSEVIRIVGICILPVGIVTGYLELKDVKTN